VDPELPEEQVYMEVMIAFSGLQVGDRGLVPRSWFQTHRQYLRPILVRRWIEEPDGASGDLPANDG
jgi:hypothetical protein